MHMVKPNFSVCKTHDGWVRFRRWLFSRRRFDDLPTTIWLINYVFVLRSYDNCYNATKSCVRTKTAHCRWWAFAWRHHGPGRSWFDHVTPFFGERRWAACAGRASPAGSGSGSPGCRTPRSRPEISAAKPTARSQLLRLSSHVRICWRPIFSNYVHVLKTHSHVTSGFIPCRPRKIRCLLYFCSVASVRARTKNYANPQLTRVFKFSETKQCHGASMAVY